MFIAGLTGGIGSGKTTVSDRLALLGADIIDTDVIARQLLAPGGEAVDDIRQVFPASSGPDGSIDRGRLRQIVFSDAEARRRLEMVLHPLIRRRVDECLAAPPISAKAPYRVLVVPLLVETGGYLPRCDTVIVIDLPEEVQAARVESSRGIDHATVRRIMDAQASRSERIRAAQFVIDNASDLGALRLRVDNLHRALCAAACVRQRRT